MGYIASEEIIDHDMYYPCTVYHKEGTISPLISKLAFFLIQANISDCRTSFCMLGALKNSAVQFIPRQTCQHTKCQFINIFSIRVAQNSFLHLDFDRSL